jgi:aspartate/methionine/tyrosine aminotransferase
MGYLAGLQGDRGWMKGYFDKVEKQRNLCLKRISQIDGLEVEEPGGAFYMFVRLTDERWRDDDKAFVLQLLEEEHVLVVHGSGFSPELGKGHIRIVYLPNFEVLNIAFDRIDNFLKRHR